MSERITPCGHDISNIDRGVESGTQFCRLCDLESRCRDAEKREKELLAERDEYKRRAELWKRLHDERVDALSRVRIRLLRADGIAKCELDSAAKDRSVIAASDGIAGEQ